MKDIVIALERRHYKSDSHHDIPMVISPVSTTWLLMAALEYSIIHWSTHCIASSMSSETPPPFPHLKRVEEVKWNHTYCLLDQKDVCLEI